MTRLEYWLLDLVVEASCPIAWTVAGNIEKFFNRDDHGATPEAVAGAFERLLGEGLIEASRWRADDLDVVAFGTRGSHGRPSSDRTAIRPV